VTSWRRAAVTSAILLAAFPAGVRAQGGGPVTGPPDTLAPRVTLITVGPGPIFFEVYGHNMIRVQDPRDGTDLAYNFGMFDTRAQAFVWHFVQGRMSYALEALPGERTLASYRRTGRSVEVQELALDPAQARLLAENLARNAEPDRMYYRYDYYRDNCSTRVRDALDAALGGAIRRALEHIPTATTYRSATADLTAGDPLYYFGLMLMLGPSTDDPLSAWEDSFIPMAFARHLETVTLGGSVETERPLVTGREYWPEQPGAGGSPGDPSTATRRFLVVGCLMGVLLVWAGQRARLGRGRGWFVTLGGLWALLSGVVGLVLVYLWAFTDHLVAYRNENVLQASILGLALCVALAGWARGRGGNWVRAVPALGWTILALSVLGIGMKVIPGPRQENWMVIAFFLPANLGMALAAWRATPGALTTAAATAALPPPR